MLQHTRLSFKAPTVPFWNIIGTQNWTAVELTSVTSPEQMNSLFKKFLNFLYYKQMLLCIQTMNVVASMITYMGYCMHVKCALLNIYQNEKC